MSTLQKSSFYENSSEAEKEELSNPQKSSCNKSQENDFDNDFEVLNEVDEVNNNIEAKLPPYFSILADALKNDNKENNFSKAACDCYEFRTLGNMEEFTSDKLHKHEGKLLASISSGKNGGAFTVQPKYKLDAETNNYEPASWLVLDCHGGPHKILKFEELYNFLKNKKKRHLLFIRYTDPKNLEQDNLTKKYYLDDGSILQNN